MDSEDGAWEASEGGLKAVPPVAVQGQTPSVMGLGASPHRSWSINAFCVTVKAFCEYQNVKISAQCTTL